MTLISAPAGFGKTTLVSEWVVGCGCPVAWLSLDERDNDLARFLAYFIAALQTIDADFGAGALAMLQSPPISIDAVLTSLVNEIAAAPNRFIVVLDDYHSIESPPVDDALTFLLEHLPPPMHLVITTREDPPLPLPRLRARRQLTEVRASDLRFTPDEAAAFLNETMGLPLSAEDVRALERRTEGWIAGLQLAALALQGTSSAADESDATDFIRAFAGDNRYIVDYLAEEVLQRQPPRIRAFLLQTSILHQLSGPLCDAVTGQADGNQLLPELERGNLFVVPLDDKRHWYRYHHLFADVLRTHLAEELPEQMAELHRRASGWYQQHDRPADAIRHALAAEDFALAAGLVELAWSAMDRTLESDTWLGWVRALPEEQVRARPVLSAGYAWALLNGGELDASEARLRDAERWLEMAADGAAPGEGALAHMVVTDVETFQSLPASVASARAFLAQARGDAPGCVKYAQRALELLPEDEPLGRAVPYGVLGLAYWGLGELESAHWAMSESMARFRETGNLVAAISATYGLADIRITQGRLRDAVRTYEQSLQQVTEHGGPPPRGTAELYLGLSDLARERGDLAVAKAHLRHCEELGESAALPNIPSRLCIARARLQEAEGNLDGALESLERAERLYFPSPVPDVRPIGALRARLWIAQGRLAEAGEWARERSLSVESVLAGGLDYLHEFEHMTLARVLLAVYHRDGDPRTIADTLTLLDRLVCSAEAGGRTGNVLEILVLQALALHAQGDIPAALVPLSRGLALAQPEEYVRIFVDEGPPMAHLLRETLAHGNEPGIEHGVDPGFDTVYVHRLLAAFPAAEAANMLPDARPVATPAVSAPAGDTPPKQPARELAAPELIEPLSERELEVLQLIAQGLTNREVAARLYLSLHTVKVHARNIYGKLAVKNRTQAVAKGRSLGLLSPS